MTELEEIGFPDGFAAAESVISSRQMGLKTKLGLWLVAEGASYRDAAEIVGSNYSQLWIAAKRHGIAPVHDMRQFERGRLLSGVARATEVARLEAIPGDALARLL